MIPSPVSYRESKGQSAAMPACSLAFASLCLQNAQLLLKGAEVVPLHDPESVLESHLMRDDDPFGQETDASGYVQQYVAKGMSININRGFKSTTEWLSMLKYPTIRAIFEYAVPG